MPADENKNAPETYDALVERLQSVVERLETGELSLEDSLREFESGIRLVRKGEELLSRAEQRIEELLSEGGQDKAVPLDSNTPAVKLPARATRPQARPAAAEDDDDVPF